MASLVREVDGDSSVGHQTIFVLRHGERYDFEVGKEKWQKVALRPHDPPLSPEIGGAQMQDNLAYFRILRETEPELRLNKVLSSPFLRCISTCYPIAAAFDASLLIEESLWEVAYQSEIMPTAAERACYFPCIDVGYQSCFRPETTEDFPRGCMERYGRAAAAIETRFMQGPSAESSLVICTHAAGVVTIVSALLRESMDNIQPASPCGLYRLDRASPSEPWVLCASPSAPMPRGNENFDALGARRGCSLAHLKHSGSLLSSSGKVSKTGSWPIRSRDMSDEERQRSSYGQSYPTWADLWLEAGETASWLS